MTAIACLRCWCATLKKGHAEEALARVAAELAPRGSKLTCACTFLPQEEGSDFSGGPSVEAKTVVQDGIVVVLVQGPWYRCTFAETPVLQCMAQFMTEQMTATGDDDASCWCREACMNFATSAHRVHDTTPEGWASLFAGRRTPHPDFHLLQHMYFAEVLGGISSSSLFAGRVFGGIGRSPPLVGTLAHEGPMAFFALHPELDERLPLSSMLWQLLFWAMTCNHTILPDAFGSASFKAMLIDLGLLSEVTMARQDSGRLERFVSLFPQTPKLASEIEKYADVANACQLGYVAAGAGGFFGEKRRTCVEFSLACKLVKTTSMCDDGRRDVGYAGKLGDAGGSWADFDSRSEGMPAKFIVHTEAPRQRLWEKMLCLGRRGDALHDRLASGGAPTPLLCRQDALALVTILRELAATPCLGNGRYAAMTARLIAFANIVEGAAANLPEHWAVE